MILFLKFFGFLNEVATMWQNHATQPNRCKTNTRAATILAATFQNKSNTFLKMFSKPFLILFARFEIEEIINLF